MKLMQIITNYFSSSLNRRVFFIFILMLGAAILLATSIIILIALSIREHNFNFINREAILLSYIKQLQNQLGDPPQQKIALEINKNTGIDIIYRDKNNRLNNWNTNRISPPKIISLDFEPLGASNNYFYGFWRNTMAVQFLHKNFQLYFLASISLDKNIAHHNITKWDKYLTVARPFFALFVFSVVLILILFIVYRKTIAMIRPIEAIKIGVDEFSKGNLNYQITKGKKSNDLSMLTDRLNLMAQKLHQSFNSKEKLLLALNHELRTPLTKIKIALNLKNRDRQMEAITKNIKLIESLIDSLLIADKSVLSKQKEAINLGKFTQNIIKEAEAKSSINFYQNSNDLVIEFNKTELQFLLNNLIENSLIYGRQRIAISINKIANSVVWKISNQGPKIKKQYMAEIFEAFSRLDESRNKTDVPKQKGIGLGLYLCKKICLAENVRFTLQSGDYSYNVNSNQLIACDKIAETIFILTFIEKDKLD